MEALASLPQIVLNIPTGGSSSAPSGSAGGGAGAGAGATGAGSGSAGSAAASASSAGGATGGGTGNTTTNNNTPTSNPGYNGLPPINHVFLIMLSEQGYNQTFGPVSPDKYLSKTLAKQGELLPNYYGIAGSPLANEVALLSGQGPTNQTLADCPTYIGVVPGTVGSNGQVLGGGCIYPSTTKTFVDQLTAKNLTWRAYVDGISKPCSHPGLAATGTEQVAINPFVFFDSVVQNTTACHQADVPLTHLRADLKSASSTPTFSYIAPSLCHDGREQPCKPGAPAGLGPADHS